MEKSAPICVVCKKQVGKVDVTTNACAECMAKRINVGITHSPVYELARKPYSNHVEDRYLELVLAQIGEKEWVTWIYNKEFDSYNTGHYFGKRDLAEHDYDERGNTTPIEYAVTVTLNVYARSEREARSVTRRAINEFDTPVNIVEIVVTGNEGEDN